MIFDIHSSQNKKVKQFYDNAVKDLNDFYQINWNMNIPKVFLISSREEFDTLYGKKTEDWVVGTTMGSPHSVYMFHPDVYEKESSHKYSDEEYEALLKHELSHLYTNIFCKGYKPVWLIEGIAIYSSGQLRQKPKVNEFKRFLEFFENGGSGVYSEAGFAVMILDKEFGREKLLELLKSLDGVKEEEDFKKIFKETYGIELNYDWFNKRVKKYI